MITKKTENTVKAVNKFIGEHSVVGDAGLNWEQIEWIDTLDRMVRCLKIAPISYRRTPVEDIAKGFYTCECDDCGWWGSSRLLDGGGQIADTGCHGDCYCPVCGSNNVEERE